VATWMGEAVAPDDVGGLPAWVAAAHVREQVLSYGENPHQPAAKYKTRGVNGGVLNALQHNGKPMSRNNYWDGNAAWRAVNIFAEPAVVIVKHTTPCGVATNTDLVEAYRKALACDPISASGGVVAVNREVTVEMAEEIVKIFTEVVLAPGYANEALEILAIKPNLRVLEVAATTADTLEMQLIDGDMLVQTTDKVDQPGDDPSGWTLMAGEAADEATLADLKFAWRAVARVKSNAILVAADGASIGIGTGQPNRVDSFRDAIRRAGDQITKCVLASDAFIPFADGTRVAIDAGVKAIVEPGGSMRDDETIELCKQHGVTLYFTGVRHFAH
jgi:phosphoribosylaminoimidazolecarboxamide formyltransferase/IMP cyclohydrolase